MSDDKDTAVKSLYSKLMEIPPEIRNTIYQHAFSFPQPLKLRSPSHRRLRPSRIRKEDTRGFLDTCHDIREEAVSIYYGMNPLVFRVPEEFLDFVHDSLIHPTIRTSVRHIAVDFGDSVRGANILENQFNMLDQSLVYLPAIRTIESRFYVRKSHRSSNLEYDIALHFIRRAAGCITPIGPQEPTERSTSVSPVSSPESSPMLSTSVPTYKFPGLGALSKTASSAFKRRGFKIKIYQTAQTYPTDRESPDTLLCCNVCISNDPDVELALGPACDAVKDRLKRVGVLPLKIFELHECPEIEKVRSRRGFLSY